MHTSERLAYRRCISARRTCKIGPPRTSRQRDSIFVDLRKQPRHAGTSRPGDGDERHGKGQPIEGLHNHCVDPIIGASAPHLGAVAREDAHDGGRGHPAAVEVLPDLVDQGGPVHSRHLHVDQNEGVILTLHELAGVPAICHEIAGEAELHALPLENFTASQIIINDQDRSQRRATGGFCVVKTG